MDNRYRSFGSFESRLNSSIVSKLGTQTFRKASLKSEIVRIELSFVRILSSGDILHSTTIKLLGCLPPADNRAIALEPEFFPAFNLSDPIPQTGGMMDNQGRAVRG